MKYQTLNSLILSGIKILLIVTLILSKVKVLHIRKRIESLKQDNDLY